jgi:hypothetical protein
MEQEETIIQKLQKELEWYHTKLFYHNEEYAKLRQEYIEVCKKMFVNQEESQKLIKRCHFLMGEINKEFESVT